MSSPLHVALVDFFRTHLDCALKLAAQVGIELAAPLPCWQVMPGDFGDPGRQGKEYQADVVLVAFPTSPMADGTRALDALVIEPQLDFDAKKGISWLVYRAGVASRYGDAGVWVLTICPDASVLLRFRDGVFPRNPELRTILIGPGSVSPVLDAAIAAAHPAWAALCAALHARGPFALRAAVIALHACDRLPADQRRCTFELIGAGLPRNIMQEVLKEMPERIKYELTDYEREGAWYQDGLDEGIAQGQRTLLLLLLDNRGLALTPEHRAGLDACSDPEQLRRWFERALRATSVDDIFTTDG